MQGGWIGMEQTYWQPRAPLRGLHRADAVIVGGGFTGVNTAALLSQAGLRVILLEAGELGGGATGACSGIVTACMGQAYQKAAELVNPEAAKTFSAMAQDALTALRFWIVSQGIACSLQETEAYVYAFLERDLEALERLMKLAVRIGLPLAASQDAGGCPFPVELSLVMREQLLLDPLAYLTGTAEKAEAFGAQIFEHSRVRRISSGEVSTEGGVVEASQVILATGLPLGCGQNNVLALLEPQIRALCRLRGGAPLHTAHISIREGGLGLRPLQGGLLASWTLGRTGEPHEKRSHQLTRVLRGRLPEYEEEARILRQEVMSVDGLPLIGSVHQAQGPVLMAAGYDGWGLCGSFLAAQALTRLVLGSPLPEDAIYHPHRRPPGHRRVMIRGMKPILRARAAGSLRLHAPRCPHMGCRLRYSHVTSRWECPCHGSTFGVLGENVTGPALRPAEVSARDRPGT